MSTASSKPRAGRLRGLLDALRSWNGVILALPKARRTLSGLIAGAVLRTLIALPLPFMMKALFDDVIPDGRTGMVLAFGFGIFAIFAVGAAFEAFLRRKAFAFATSGTADLRQRLHHAIMEAPVDSMRKLGSGGLFDVVGTNVQRVENASVALVGVAMPAVILSAVFAVMVTAIEWRLMLVGALLTPFMVIPGAIFGRKTRDSWTQHHDIWGEYNEFTQRATRLNKLTRASSAEQHELTRHRDLALELREISWRSRVANNDYSAAMRTALALAGTGVLIAGARMVADGTITLGHMVSFFAALTLLRPPLQRLIETVPMLSEGKPALDLVEELLALEQEPRAYANGTKQIELKGFLTAEGIAFSFPGRDEPLFQDLNIEVHPGDITVIVGPNGAGKSTLVSLLLGLRTPTEGRLLADGIPFEELDMTSIRRQMALLVQELMLDEGPVVDIIGYGLGDSASREDVIAAAELADAASFIEELPDGYDSVIGRNGAELSLGQHQRLSIARALARKPSVLILDEPTNHLDPAAVKTVLTSLRELDHAPAVVIVTHHADVVKWADHVVTITPPSDQT